MIGADQPSHSPRRPRSAPLQTLHLSLLEFLTDPGRSGVHAADVAAGHSTLAVACARVLRERDSGPTLEYSLLHGHGHLAAAADSADALAAWFGLFLEPRPPVDGVAGPQRQVGVEEQAVEEEKEQREEEAEKEEEEEEEAEEVVVVVEEEQTAAGAGTVTAGGSVVSRRTCVAPTSPRRESSAWRAVARVGAWLELQAEHGRSKRLVPEMWALADALRRSDGGGSHALDTHRGGLSELATALAWGVGTHWAPLYDTDAEAAKARFWWNTVATSCLHASPAKRRHSRAILRLPPRLAIDRTRLVLRGHSGSVRSACFSADGRRVVTGSDDKTARVWSATTGAMEVELRGHSGRVFSACFSADGRRVVTGSGDKTARVWSATTGAMGAGPESEAKCDPRGKVC